MNINFALGAVDSNDDLSLTGTTFLQPWILNHDLRLSSTLLAMQVKTKGEIATIPAPTTRLARSVASGPKSAFEPFIAPNGFSDVAPLDYVLQRQTDARKTDGLLMDWQRIFENVFLHSVLSNSSVSYAGLGHLLENTSEGIKNGIGQNNFKVGNL